MGDPEDLQAAIAEAVGTLVLGLVRGEEEMELSVALG
jgi:hypothetical protein